MRLKFAQTCHPGFDALVGDVLLLARLVLLPDERYFVRVSYYMPVNTVH
jgi:hypothetical protein